MILIGSSAHPELNVIVSKKSQIPLADCTVEKFSNGEIKVIVNVSVRGQDVYVVTTGCAPINDNLMETLIICKACKTSNAKSITLIMANYPYARQDRKTKSRECISASFVAEMIEISGVNRMITFDLHSGQIQGMFRIPIDNIYTYKPFANHLKIKYPTMSKETHIVVSPDAGATKRCRELAMRLGLKMALIEKTRNYSNNDQIERMILIEQEDCIKDKTVILYDDIADTMGTMCKACELLKENKAKEVIAVVTHGVLSGSAIERLEKCEILTQMICSNTIPVPKHKKIDVCDLSDLICQSVTCLQTGASLTALFDK